MSKIVQLEGDLSAKALLAVDEQDRVDRTSNNAFKGSGGRHSCMILPNSLSQESESNTMVQDSPGDGGGSLVGITTARPDIFNAFLPMGNEDEWADDEYSQHIINGCHPKMIMEISDDGDGDTMTTLEPGQQVMASTQYSNEGSNGSPETNGRYNRLRIRTAGLVSSGFQSFGNLVASVADAFSGGSSGTPMPLPENTPEDVKKFAGSYDAEESIPNKSQHAPKLAECHTEVVPYIKAFIYRCWTEKEISIRINSTYRSPAHQKRLRDAWDNGTAQYKKDNAKPASPGSSWHNTGMAFDFNPKLKSGLTLMKATDKGT